MNEKTLQEKLRHFGDQNDVFDENTIMRQAADRIDELERQLAEAQKLPNRLSGEFAKSLDGDIDDPQYSSGFADGWNSALEKIEMDRQAIDAAMKVKS